MTTEERNEMFSREILSADDIAKLFDVSKHTAYVIIRNIKLKSDRLDDGTPGRTTLTGKVHVQDYLDCYGLDRDSSRYNGGDLKGYRASIPSEDRQRHAFYPSVMDTRY